MEDSQKVSWKERLEDAYRVDIRHEDTFSQIGSYRLTLLHLYLGILGAFLIVLGLVMAVFFLTPLRTFVPGYGQIEDQSAFIKLKRDYNELEEQVEAQQTYINSFRRMLTDNPEEIQEAMTVDSNIQMVETDGQVIKEDSVFREKVENEDDLREVRALLGETTGDAQPITLESLHFTPPVKGEVTAKFMPENLHYGVDIMAPSNTPILAALDGMVITSDWTLETGYTLGILHSQNIVTFYKHNSANLKKTGERVKAGEAIAIIGNSGTLTTGPHLHFELWLGDKAVDPAEYILFE